MDSQREQPEPFEAAVGEPCFSLRAKLTAMGVDPNPALAVAHALLSSGIPLDVKRFNPSVPMANVNSG